MLYHGWTYLNLIQDVFGIKNNTIEYSEDPNAPNKTTYALDFDSDQILKDNAFQGFHEAGPAVDKALNEWKAESQKLNATQTSAEAISTALTNAMDALPEMTARKTKIDMHVQIASKILAEIGRRELNNLQDWEDEIMSSPGNLNNQTKTDLLRYLGRETASTSQDEFNDKLRTLIIIVLCTNDRQLVSESLEAVKNSNPEQLTPALDAFLKKLARQRNDFSSLAKS